MKKIYCILFFTGFLSASGNLFAGNLQAEINLQSSGEAGDTVRSADTALVTVLNYFHLDGKTSFFHWKEKPADFEFKLYDRWGNTLAESCDAGFIIDDVLLVKKDRFRENETYIYVVVITDTTGLKKKYFGHVCCLGYYCAG